MIRRATKEDLVKINELMVIYGQHPVTENMLLDLCLVSDRKEGGVMGFIYGMISTGKTHCFVDYLTVHPAAKGDGYRLGRAMIKECHKLGIEKLFSVVRMDESKSAEQSYLIQLKLGLLPSALSYCLFIGDVERMAS